MAYAHRQMERAAYQWNVELSVYLVPKAIGQGIGSGLYSRLIALLKQQHVQTLYAMITLPNEASVALHHAFGFRKPGVYRHTGYKCDEWYDVLCMDLSIGEAGEPLPLVPSKSVDSLN